MTESTCKLFLENYNNLGLCKELPEIVRKIEKNFRSGKQVIINYLPWASVERIFKLQGGTIEVVELVKKVAIGSEPVVDILSNTTSLKEHQAFFVHLKAHWQELEEEEFYPVFNSQDGKTIEFPQTTDINASRQRGMVRLIARISGIGLSLFEINDSFDEPEKGKKEASPKQEKEASPKAKEQPIEITEVEENAFYNGTFLDAIEEEQDETTSDLILEIKGKMPFSREKIASYLKSKNKESLQDLTKQELKELNKQL